MTAAAERIREAPAAVRPTVQAARRAIRAAAPGAEEIAYAGGRPRSGRMMWKLLRYAVDGKPVVGLGVFATYATIYFFRGRDLPDPAGVLEGGGKTMRSIKLRAPRDIARPEVKRIVRAAFRLGG